MSKVGVCRITTIGCVILFYLFVIVFSEYYFIKDKRYKDDTSLKVIMQYILPCLVVLCLSVFLPTYILCITIKPRDIPSQYTLTTAEMAQFLLKPNYQEDYQTVAALTRQYMKSRPNLIVRERDFRHGGLRVCEICCIIKPDRSHHCTICNKCVIRMDHHCHWVNNCIHGDNHKYFIQLITFGVITGFLVFVNYLINVCEGCTHIPDTKDDMFMPCIFLYTGCILSGVMVLALLFLTLDHCINLFRGQTSYERIYDRDHYNRGWANNFYQVMGTGFCQWVFPLIPSKLDSEYEPLIVTIDEHSSHQWRDSSRTPSRHQSSSAVSATLHSQHIDDSMNLEDTLSLIPGELDPVRSPPASRVRSPSTITEQDIPPQL